LHVARTKQQGNGGGSVYPRKNKHGKITSYLGAYYGPDGKRRTVSAKTKSDAREKLRQAMADADRGLVFEAGTLTVGEYLNRWLPSITDKVRQSTWERYESVIRVHLEPALGKLRLKDLTRAHVNGLYANLKPPQHAHITLRKP
jgi:integrase